MTAGFALIVRIELVEAHRADFLAAIRINAATSVAQEPGCSRFDVLTPPDGPANQVLLYEVYSDRAGFDQHLLSEHFQSFDATTRRMVRSKTIDFFDATPNTKA